MKIHLTIIGLGQIGASIGLALEKYADKIIRTGYDRAPAVMQEARSRNIVDETAATAAESVQQADLVLLALPLDEIPQTIQKIAQSLPEDCVVLETSPIKSVVYQWMQEALPPQRHHVGMIPVLNPSYLHQTGKGIAAAHADLFQHSMMVVASHPDTPAEAIKLATDLTRLIGSDPVFMNLAEADAAMASVHILPQLQAAALLNATVNLPEWSQAQHLAGRPYAAATAPIIYQDDRLALRDAALLNSENVVHALDGLIAALRYLRQAIAEQDKETLQQHIQRAHEGRSEWWKSREKNDWLSEELESAQLGGLGDYFGHLVGSRPRKKP